MLRDFPTLPSAFLTDSGTTPNSSTCKKYIAQNYHQILKKNHQIYIYIIINGLILPLHPVLCCFKRDSKFVFLIKVLVLLTLFSSSLHFQRAAAPYCLSRMLQCSFVRSQEPWPYRMLLLVLMFDVKALSDECSKTSSQ